MAAVVSLFWHSIMLERPEVMLLVWGAAMLGTFLLDLCIVTMMRVRFGGEMLSN